MKFAQAVTQTSQERRANERSRVSCAARLRTSYSNWVGHLWDISITGARFQVENPPKSGVTALLEWEPAEAMCKVVWSMGDVCGLQFERPLKQSVVDRCTSKEEATGPVASVGNIPLGKRRTRP